MLTFLASFIGSNTLGLALTLIPLLGRAFEKGHADEWIYDKLPSKIKAKGSLTELGGVLSTGKAFIKAVWAFLH
jgi:hypothetical protein